MKQMRCDQGHEFMASAMGLACYRCGVFLERFTAMGVSVLTMDAWSLRRELDLLGGKIKTYGVMSYYSALIEALRLRLATHPEEEIRFARPVERPVECKACGQFAAHTGTPWCSACLHIRKQRETGPGIAAKMRDVTGPGEIESEIVTVDLSVEWED